jgi:DNA adenine methylase
MTAYHGGKQRIGKLIAQVIYEESTNIENVDGFAIKGYCEPFCGMLGVYQHIPELFKNHSRKLKYNAGDVNKSIIMMWKAAQKGWEPPLKITKKEFLRLKYDGKSSADKGFIGHYYGYMGKYFQPFDNRHTIKKTQNTINKIKDISTNLSEVSFSHNKYTKFSNLKNYVIYCDPPYTEQSHYYTEDGKHTEPFDKEMFWDWCRKMAKHNIIFVSEYKAPKDFEKIYEVSSRTTGVSKKEKLFFI